MRERKCYRSKVGRAGHECDAGERKHEPACRERGYHHLAARTKSTERASRVHTGEGEKESSSREYVCEDEDVAGRQVRRERANEGSARSERERCSEDNVGSRAKYPRGVFRYHFVFRVEFYEVSVRLEHAGT